MSGDSATDQFETYADLLRELSTRVEGVRWFSCGTDLGLRNGNADFAVIAIFENETAFRCYLEDHLHVEITRAYASKMVNIRTTVQLRV